MTNILTIVHQALCKHEHTIIRVDRAEDKTGRMYTECLTCLHQTVGIATGTPMLRGAA